MQRDFGTKRLRLQIRVLFAARAQASHGLVLAAVISIAPVAKIGGVREATRQTGVPAADFTCICNANIGRFTVDRLMIILEKMGCEVEVGVQVLEAA